MGLDMKLLSFRKPTEKLENKTLSYEETEALSAHCEIYDKRAANAPAVIMNNSIECIATGRKFDIPKIIHDALIAFGMRHEIAEYASHRFKPIGSSGNSLYDLRSYRYDSSYEDSDAPTNEPREVLNEVDQIVHDLFTEFQTDIDWASNARDKTTLIMQKQLYSAEDGSIGVSICKNNTIKIAFTGHSLRSYRTRCDYVCEYTYPCYISETQSLCYQQGGLNEYGDSLLPENCQICDDRERVEKLVRSGGLDECFLDEWVDGKTAFHAWW